jgi:pimeloyl-ACP methyl ester carboxylesterase
MSQPVLLLIPGMSNTPAVWGPTRAHLGEGDGLEVRVIDVRQAADIPAMARAGWRALADLPAERPVLLAGFSMGGYVALQMLAQAPRPVQGLALVCSSARPDSPDSAPMRERAIAAATRDYAKYVNSVTQWLLAHAPDIDPALLQAIRADQLAAGAEATVAQQRAVSLRADQRPLLRGLGIPLLAVAGERDQLVPPALSREAAELAPGARLEIVPGVGHLLPWEAPQGLGTVLRGWALAVHQELQTRGDPS